MAHKKAACEMFPCRSGLVSSSRRLSKKELLKRAQQEEILLELAKTIKQKNSKG